MRRTIRQLDFVLSGGDPVGRTVHCHGPELFSVLAEGARDGLFAAAIDVAFPAAYTVHLLPLRADERPVLTTGGGGA